MTSLRCCYFRKCFKNLRDGARTMLSVQTELNKLLPRQNRKAGQVEKAFTHKGGIAVFPGDNDPLIDGNVLKLGDYSEVHNNDSILSKNGYAEMARDFMAQMLDELMGRNRNARPDERQDLRWDDPTVCKHFLAVYCPNELFTNTKADLGVCRLIHDDDLKNQYQADSRKGTMGYEDAFLRFLRTMVQDVDRRIDRGKGRLEATRQVSASNAGTKYDEKIRDLTQRIEDLVQEAEKLGSQGKVEEAQGKLRQSDQLRKDRDGMKATLEIAVQQEKQLEVCQTCGAFLIVGDAQQRIDDHLAGKQHVGYARIRQTLKEEEERIQKELEERRKERERRLEERESSRGKSERKSEKKDDDSVRSGRTRSRERSKKSPSRERSKRHRSRSRSNDKSRRRRSRSRSHNRSKRHRSRSGSRKKDRDGSRDRHHSSKHESRDGSKDRGHRSSKSDKRHRSRSRDEKRRRSRSRDRESKRLRSRSRDDKRRHRNGSVKVESPGEESGSGSKQTESQNEQVPSLELIQLPKGGLAPVVPAEEEISDE